MRRVIIIAAVALIAVMSLSPTKLEAGPAAPKIVPAAAAGHVGAVPWALMACPALIVVTGAFANFKDNRQLTFWEAWTCGLAYWLWIPGPTPSKARTH